GASGAGEVMTAAAIPGAAAPLVELKGVSKRFAATPDVAARLANALRGTVRDEVVHAVDGVDLAISEREVLGLVGESGGGKSTLGSLAVGLLAPSAGARLWRGAPAAKLGDLDAREQQLKMQMVFQDPYASLNPRLRIVDIVGEAPVVHGLIGRRQQIEYVA